MSGSHHDDHHSHEVKPVSFTVPFILASVFLLIMFLFLSLCDPKHGHGCDMEEHGHHAAGVEATHHDAATEEHHDATHEAVMADSTATAAPAIAPEVEGKPEEAHH